MTVAFGSPDNLQASLHALFDSMFEGVQVVDFDFRYLYVNHTATVHNRRTSTELLGQRMMDMYPGIEHTEVFARIQRCMTERTPQQIVNEFVFPDGTSGWFDVRAAPIPPGVLILSFDVSAQKGTEAELRRLVAALEDTDRRKNDFLMMLAHELRNPLAPIRNGVHVLRERMGRSEPAVARATEMIDRQARQLSHLVDGLLEVTRLSVGKVQLQMERLDAGALVREVVGDRRASFDARQVTLTVEAPEVPVWVQGDHARLTQVMSNVLDNALKFTPEGGEVHVIVTADGAHATIVVRDTGVGIPAHALPTIFDALAQADTSLDRSVGGLGLGLAVVKGLMELHDGQAEAESAGEGQGTTLRLRLPQQPEHPAVDPTVKIKRAGPQKARVLVIEDNRDAAESLAMILDLWGFAVETAYTGHDGVDQAKATVPDIVLCDIGLPGMDGYAVARTLRAAPKTRAAQLIAITGYGRDEDRRRSVEAGFDTHLVKPVDPDELRRHLHVA